MACPQTLLSLSELPSSHLQVEVVNLVTPNICEQVQTKQPQMGVCGDMTWFITELQLFTRPLSLRGQGCPGQGVAFHLVNVSHSGLEVTQGGGLPAPTFPPGEDSTHFLGIGFPALFGGFYPYVQCFCPGLVRGCMCRRNRCHT